MFHSDIDYFDSQINALKVSTDIGKVSDDVDVSVRNNGIY